MRMYKPWKTLFWDLDGTITDPQHGIIGAYRAFLTERGLDVPADKELLWVIGPPLRDCLKQILHTEDETIIEDAVLRYRYWYVQEGYMYRDTPYDGIRELLQDLQNAGTRMFVATAKAHAYARQILVHWGLGEFFEEIHGSELDGTNSNKADLLKGMLERYSLTGSPDIVMLGDRKHDAIAGKANGLTTIGVGYGYGSEAELRSAGVDYYCPTLKDLRVLLTGH